MGEKSSYYIDVGKRIEENRKFLGYSQEYVAEALDISDREYRRIEKGEVVIYASTLMALTNIGFDIHYLFFGRVAMDIYMDKALATMPEEMISQNIDKMDAFLSKVEPGVPVCKQLTREEIEEMKTLIDDMVDYGTKHFQDAADLDDGCTVFTNFFHKNVPERIKRKERGQRVKHSQPVILE